MTTRPHGIGIDRHGNLGEMGRRQRFSAGDVGLVAGGWV